MGVLDRGEGLGWGFRASGHWGIRASRLQGFRGLGLGFVVEG